jgi:hypothetical protein
LFLCFDFDNETGRIFEGLRRAGDWSVITLQDDAGRVIASSDPWQIAPGALVAAPDGDGHLVRFAGASYLASRHAAQGFQGYMGPPGWRALVLVPLAMASEHDDEEDSGVAPADAPLVRAILRSGATFSPALQAIPRAGRRHPARTEPVGLERQHPPGRRRRQRVESGVLQGAAGRDRAHRYAHEGRVHPVDRRPADHDGARAAGRLPIFCRAGDEHPQPQPVRARQRLPLVGARSLAAQPAR